MLRHRAHHVVRSMQEHASMSLHEAWSLFHQQAILGGGGGLGNVTELRCLHDAYVRRMSVSCFIMDDDLRSISHELLRVCLRCSHVVTLSSRENNDHQFELFRQRAMELKERMSTLLRTFTQLMTRHHDREHFAALVLTLKSLE